MLGDSSPSPASRKPTAHARLPHTILRLRPDSARVTHFLVPSSPRELTVRVMNQETHCVPQCLLETFLHTCGREAVHLCDFCTLRHLMQFVRSRGRMCVFHGTRERSRPRGCFDWAYCMLDFTSTLFILLIVPCAVCATF